MGLLKRWNNMLLRLGIGRGEGCKLLIRESLHCSLEDLARC